jgi:hypothetical protein
LANTVDADKHMDQNHPQRSKERGGGIANGRETTVWSN